MIILRESVLLVIFAYLASARTNRGKLVGGWAPMDINHEGVKETAKYATNVLNDRSNGMHYENLIHIHEALSQVVAGAKYNITIDIGQTICPKNEVELSKVDNCTLDQNATIKRCKITVWSKPWLNWQRLLHSECTPFLSYPEYFSEKHISEDQAYHQNKESSYM